MLWNNAYHTGSETAGPAYPQQTMPDQVTVRKIQTHHLKDKLPFFLHFEKITEYIRMCQISYHVIIYMEFQVQAYIIFSLYTTCTILLIVAR